MSRITMKLVRVLRRVSRVSRHSARHAEIAERLDYVDDSLAAQRARDERDAAVPWRDVR